MEGFILLYVVVTLMLSSGAQGQSMSMSCSTVNGRQICETQRNQGNMASSSSQAISGGANGDYQNAYAGAGSPNDWSSSQTQEGNAPPAGSFPGFPGGFGFGGFGFPNSGGGSGSSQTFSSSSSGSGTGNQGAAGAPGSGNQGGGFQSFGPGTYTYTSTNGGSVGNGAFAAAGGFAGGFPGPMPMPMNPATFNPFAFVFGRR